MIDKYEDTDKRMSPSWWEQQGRDAARTRKTVKDAPFFGSSVPLAHLLREAWFRGYRNELAARRGANQ